MDATVVQVVVAPGDDVDAGAVLVVLEAMKMELPVRAPAATRVDAVHVAPGDRVTAGSALVTTTPAVIDVPATSPEITGT
jgi:acetyl-CoA/propionyl-CoA carboxylase, biotin carboxylase, biotin carboxyl carrier protein